MTPAPTPGSPAITPEPCSCRWWLESADYWFSQAEALTRSLDFWRERDVDMVIRLIGDADRCAEQAAVCTHMAFLAAGEQHAATQRRAA